MYLDNISQVMNEFVLDPNVFAEMRELMDDALGEFIDTYLENSPKLIAQMEQGLADNDPEEIYRGAHQLKGGSGSIGALKLTNIAVHIEQLCKAGSIQGVDNLLAQLKSEYEKVASALQAEI